MPLILKPEQLTAGMVLNHSVMRGAMLLLPAGRTLSGDDIEQLQSRYPELRVGITDAALDGVIDFEDDSQDRKVADTAKTRANEAIAAVFNPRPNATSPAAKASQAKKFDQQYNSVERAVGDIIRFIVSNPVGTVLPKPAYEPESYLADHTANVFYMAMVLGSRCIDYVVSERERQTHSNNLGSVLARNLEPLGLGAMFMDLGMVELEHLEQKTEPLTKSEWELIRNHPNSSAAQMPDRMPPAARMVIRTHHENMDGSGYPAQPKGEKMHVFSRIIRLCDSFDAAITPRAWRESKSSIRVLWEMAYGPNREKFDPVLVKSFCQMVQPFQVGTRVKLNNGRWAIVTGRTRDPFAPKVVIAFDEHGNLLPKERISPEVILDETSELMIRSVDDEDVSYMYERPDENADAENNAA